MRQGEFLQEQVPSFSLHSVDILPREQLHPTETMEVAGDSLAEFFASSRPGRQGRLLEENLQRIHRSFNEDSRETGPRPPSSVALGQKQAEYRP
jgi:hypothetical protein